MSDDRGHDVRHRRPPGRRAGPRAARVHRGERRPEKLAAITVLELYEGIELADRSEAERSRVLEVLDSKHVVPAGQEVMQRAREISGAPFAAGNPFDREDCIVAATALREDAPVITRNGPHFEWVEGLKVVTY